MSDTTAQQPIAPIDHDSSWGQDSHWSSWISQWGARVIDGITFLGDLSLFAWQMTRWLVTRLPCRGTILVNFYQVGARSLPVIALTGPFIGMV
ncbi:MAG: hypothetical protein ACPHL6_12220, partial [Rubripirellula sp.]